MHHGCLSTTTKNQCLEIGNYFFASIAADYDDESLRDLDNTL
jgi:hypothetical protein